ncbi:MAG: glycosyltransferase [Prevotellaceae bacterium]|nr:glycosyltransferase [Candidatus Colivivens equi]
MMIVSVVIPIYNAAQYIEKCLRSVMNQTVAQCVECILVDDCGEDNSIGAAESFLAKEGYCACECGTFVSTHSSLTFRIVHHDHNKGHSAARNTGIDVAQGKYIYFLDSDDWIIPDCLEKMLELAIKYPDSQIIFAGATATSGRYNWLDYEKKTLPEYSCDHDWLQLSMLRRFDFGMTCWNKLILRSFILEHNLSFVEGYVHQDEMWNFDLSKHIQSAAFLKQNTYVYNIRDNSTITGASDDVRWKRLFALWYVLLSKLDENNKEIQIRAIAACIIEKTGREIPKHHRMPLFKLFYKLSTQSQGVLSLVLFVQGTLALCIPSKFKNHYTCSCIRL